MKSVLLIGLGRFGRHMAQKLRELHHEVMAVDRNEERINDALPFVTNAQIGDSTSEQFIASLGVSNFDLCVVAIGDDFQSSLETTALLKEYGAPFVLSRAARDVHAKFLLRATDCTMAEIAQEIGLESIPYFTRLFHRVTGQTPSAFRAAGGRHKTS